MHYPRFNKIDESNGTPYIYLIKTWKLNQYSKSSIKSGKSAHQHLQLKIIKS